MSSRPHKVAVWATGGVGKYAIRTIADRPNLELVGVWFHSPEKDGKGAGYRPFNRAAAPRPAAAFRAKQRP
jgi:hypothetical protein